MRLFSIIICILFLGSCSSLSSSKSHHASSLHNDWQQFSDENQTFTIGVPPAFEIGKHAVQGVIKGPGFFSSESDVKIYEFPDTASLFSSSPNTPPSPCSPSLTGASSTTPLLSANGEAAWGRVDFWDYTGALSALYNNAPDPFNVPPAPLCTPPDTDVMEETRTLVTCPTPEEKATLSEDDLQWLPCRQRMRDYEVKHGLNSAYALCSKKNDKTVVICISQMKDDPSLAKKIFETFRWTE